MSELDELRRKRDAAEEAVVAAAICTAQMLEELDLSLSRQRVEELREGELADSSGNARQALSSNYLRERDFRKGMREVRPALAATENDAPVAVPTLQERPVGEYHSTR